MKPSRPQKKGNKKFIQQANSSEEFTFGSDTGSLVVSSGEKICFIGLSKTNITVGAEFLKVKEAGSHIVLSMSSVDNFLKGLHLSQQDSNGTLRLLPPKEYTSTLVIKDEAPWGLMTEMYADENDWYVWTMSAGSKPNIAPTFPSVYTTYGRTDFDDENNPEGDNRSNKVPEHAPEIDNEGIEPPRRRVRGQFQLLEYNVEGDPIEHIEFGITKTYKLTVRTKGGQATSVDYVDEMGLLVPLTQHSTKMNLWYIEGIEITENGSHEFDFVAENADGDEAEATIVLDFPLLPLQPAPDPSLDIQAVLTSVADENGLELDVAQPLPALNGGETVEITFNLEVIQGTAITFVDDADSTSLVPLGDNRWSYTVVIDADGEYSWSFTAEDNDGNTSTVATPPIIIGDSAAIRASLISIVDGDGNTLDISQPLPPLGLGGSIDLTFNFEITVGEATTFVNDATGTGIVRDDVLSWSYAETLNSDGAHSWSFTATDVDGNTAIVPVSLEIEETVIASNENVNEFAVALSAIKDGNVTLSEYTWPALPSGTTKNLTVVFEVTTGTAVLFEDGDGNQLTNTSGNFWEGTITLDGSGTLTFPFLAADANANTQEPSVAFEVAAPPVYQELFSVALQSVTEAGNAINIGEVQPELNGDSRTYTFTITESVGNISSITDANGDAFTSNGDGTWYLDVIVSSSGLSNFLFTAVSDTGLEATVSVSLNIAVEPIFAPAPNINPAQGEVEITEEGEVIIPEGDFFIVPLAQDYETDLFTLSMKIKSPTPVWVINQTGVGSIKMTSTTLELHKDGKSWVIAEDVSANFTDNEYHNITLVFDARWSRSSSQRGRWRMYGSIDNNHSYRYFYYENLNLNNQRTIFATAVDGIKVGPADNIVAEDGTQTAQAFQFRTFDLAADFDASFEQIESYNAKNYAYVDQNQNMLLESLTPDGRVTVEAYEDNYIDSLPYVAESSRTTIYGQNSFQLHSGVVAIGNGLGLGLSRTSPIYNSGRTMVVSGQVKPSHFTDGNYRFLFSKYGAQGTQQSLSPDNGGWYVALKLVSEVDKIYQLSFNYTIASTGYLHTHESDVFTLNDDQFVFSFIVSNKLTDNLNIFLGTNTSPILTTNVNRYALLHKSETPTKIPGEYDAETFGVDPWPFGIAQIENGKGGPMNLVLGGYGGNDYSKPMERFMGSFSHFKMFYGELEGQELLDAQLVAQNDIEEIPSMELNPISGIYKSSDIPFVVSGTWEGQQAIQINGEDVTMLSDGTWSYAINDLVAFTSEPRQVIATSGAWSQSHPIAISIDDIPPSIILPLTSGDIAQSGDVIEITQGEIYPYPEADDGVSVVNSDSTLDTSILGDQTITYTCQDEAGNIAAPLVITYRVSEWQPQHLEDGEKNGNNWSIGPNSLDSIGNLWINSGANNLSTFNNSDIYRYATRQTVYVWFKVEQPYSTKGIVRFAGSAREGTSSNAGWSLTLNRIDTNTPKRGRQIIEYKLRKGNGATVVRFEIKDSLGNIVEPRDGNWHNIIISYGYDSTPEIRCWFDGVAQNRDLADAGHQPSAPVSSVANIDKIHVGAQNYHVSNLVENYAIDALTITNDFIDDALAVARYNSYMPHEIRDLDGATMVKQSTLTPTEGLLFSQSYKIFNATSEVTDSENRIFVGDGTISSTFQLSDGFTKNISFAVNDETLLSRIYSKAVSGNGATSAGLSGMSYENKILTMDGNGWLQDADTSYLYEQDMSFCIWLKLDSSVVSPVDLFTFNQLGTVSQAGGSRGFHGQIGPTLAYAMLHHNKTVTSDISNINDGEWHLYTIVTRNRRDNFDLYIDDVKVGTKVADETGWNTKQYGLRVGRAASNSFYHGQLTNANVFDVALEESQVSTIYNQGHEVNSAPIEILSATLNGQDIFDKSSPILLNIGDNLSGLTIETTKEAFTIDATSIDTTADFYRDYYPITVTDSLGFTDTVNVYLEVGNPVPIDYIEEMPSLITYDSGDAATQTYVEGTTNAYLNNLNQLEILSSGFARTSTKEIGQIDGEKTISFWVKFDNSLPNSDTWVLSKMDVDSLISTNLRGWSVGFRQTNAGITGRVATNYINQNGYVDNGYLIFSSGNSDILQHAYRLLIFRLNTPFQANELMHFAIKITNVGEGLVPKLKVYHDGVLITESIKIGQNYHSYTQPDAEGWLHAHGEIESSVEVPLTIGRFIEEEAYSSTVGQFNGLINDLKISDGLTSDQDIYNEGSRTVIQQITFDGQVVYDLSDGTDLLNDFYTIPLGANPEDHISFTTIATTTSNISAIDTSVEGGIHHDLVATNSYDGDNSFPRTLRLIIGNPVYNGLEDIMSPSLVGNTTYTTENTLAFDGNGDYAVLPHHRNYDITEEKTISLWFKTSALKTGLNSFATLLSKWNYSNNYGFALYAMNAASSNSTLNNTINSLGARDHGYLRIAMGDDQTNPGMIATSFFKFHREVDDNLWHNLVVQVSDVAENTRPRVRAYLDGVLMDGRSYNNGLPDAEGYVTHSDNVSWTNEDVDLYIGATSRIEHFFNGEIDGVWFESGIKDPALIQQEGSAYQISSITIGGDVVYDPSQSIDLLGEVHNIPLNEDPETYIQIATGGVTTNNLSEINTTVESGLSFDITITDDFGRTHETKTVLLTIGNYQANGIEDLLPHTLVGSATLLNSALDVPTDSDYMIKPHQTIYDIDQTKTISFWFNKTSLETTTDRHHNALSKWNTSGDGYGYGMALSAAGTSFNLSNNKLTADDYITNGYFRLYMVNAPSTNHSSNSSFFKFNKSVTDGQWHQIVVQFNNVVVGQNPLVRVFLDGAVLTEGFGFTNNSNLSTISNGWVAHRFYPEPSMPNNDLLIGQQVNLSWRGFKGQLDGVNYENGIVEEATILARYNAGR